MTNDFSTETPASDAASPPPPAADHDAKKAKLDQCENDIRGLLTQVRAASKASLHHYKSIGEKLDEAKPLVGHGGLGSWVEKTFGIKRKWASQLTKLAKNWKLIKPLLDEENWPRPGYSVDEACSVIRELSGPQKPKQAAAPKAKKSRAELEKQLDDAKDEMNRLQIDAEAKIMEWSQKYERLETENQALQKQLAKARSDLQMSSATGHLGSANGPTVAAAGIA